MQLNKEREVPITIRQVKYLNNIVEQDHRAIKRITRPMLGFKSFRAARAILAGIELMHMIRKGQFMLKREACRLPTSFTHWQDNSVWCKKLLAKPGTTLPCTR